MTEEPTTRAQLQIFWRRQSLIVRRYFRVNTPANLAAVAIATFNRVSLRTALITVTLLLIASITIAALTAIALARDTPSWWRDANLNTPVTQDLARRVEIAIVEHVHKPRTESNQWRVSVNVEQANAWLNTKLPAWVESRELEWPEKVAQVQADFNDGVITLGARLNKDAASQIVAASFQLEVRSDGALWIKQPRARAGRLDLPSGWTVARLREWLPPELDESEVMNRVLLALAGDAPLFDEARLKLGDGRIVRMLRITSSDDQLLIEALTMRPAAPTAQTLPAPVLPPELTPRTMVDAVDTPDAPREKAAEPRQ
jgi:hypothetical protein